jgi:chaperonin GroES
MNIIPLRDKVLVKPIKEEEEKVGSIIIPDTAKERPQKGEVVAVGKGKLTSEGKEIPVEVKKGDKILYGKYAGTEVEIDGEEYLIMNGHEIMAVFE